MPKGVYQHRPLSEETKKKIGNFWRGKKRPPLSEETKKKISLSTMGRNRGVKNPKHSLRMIGVGNPFYGKKHKPETLEKLKLANIGKPNPNKGKSLWQSRPHPRGMLGKKHSLETRLNVSKKLSGRSNFWLKGREISIEERKKRSVATMGQKSRLWRHGLGNLHKTQRQIVMQSFEYKLWRESVFERDNYTCVWCGKIGGELNADHIKSYANYPELRLDISNGRTLCVPCHRKTGTWGNLLLKTDKVLK